MAVFDQDLTEHGLACINIFPDSHLPVLFEHLAGVAGTRMGCLNVQPEDPVIRRRIQAWRAWRGRPSPGSSMPRRRRGAR